MIDNRPHTADSNMYRSSSSKAYRMNNRTTSSIDRKAPEFFKDARIRTCSSIKLIHGVPKAISFPIASNRSRSAKLKYDSIKKQQTSHPTTIYQYVYHYIL